MNKRFEIHRADGRSHREVLIEHVANAEPGTTFPYQDLLAVLNAGVERPFDRRAVCAIVRRANTQLLRTYQRELRSVPTVGFRVVPASEQLTLADHRRAKANRQMSRAVLSLENLRIDELTPTERTLHAFNMMAFREVAHQLQGLRARQAKQDEVIARLLQRQDEHAAQLARLTANELG